MGTTRFPIPLSRGRRLRPLGLPQRKPAAEIQSIFVQFKARLGHTLGARLDWIYSKWLSEVAPEPSSRNPMRSKHKRVARGVAETNGTPSRAIAGNF